MTINRYRGNSLKSALEKATAEMGPDAKILHVRKLNDFTPNNSGYGNAKTPEMIEIIAVVGDDDNLSNDSVIEKSIFGDFDKKEKPRSINMLVNDDLSTADLNSFKDTEDMFISKPYIRKNKAITSESDERKPKPLSEVLKAYSSKTYPSHNNTKDDINQEKRISIIENMEKQTNAVSKKDDITDQLSQTETKNSNKSVYAETPKTLSSLLDEPPKKSKRDINWDAISEAKQKPKYPKSRISQMLYECLIKNQVNNDITYEILSILNDNEGNDFGVRDYLLNFLTENLSVSKAEEISKKVIVLIGPTGVGKTTTLAKLAAQYHFQRERNVGLITIDAYRIAAIEQLKTYAQIMSIPLKVALTPEQLWKCIDEYKDMDTILIDTPGRSHLNIKEVKLIEEFLEAAQPADTHLLISASTKDNDAYTTLENFAPNYVQKYIFTKLDETLSFGLILNICSKLKKPISYFTIGQNVPDDIKSADLDYLADLFVARKRFSR